VLVALIAIHYHLQQVTGRLMQVGGVEGTGDAQRRSLRSTLKRLVECDKRDEEALSMDQVQSELQEWQEANSASAKQGMKQQQAGAKQGRCGSVTLGSAAGVSKMGSGRKGSVHDLSFGLRSSQGGGGDTDSLAAARDAAAKAAGDDDSEQTRRPSGEKALPFKPRKATVSPMDLAPPAPLSVFPSRETIADVFHNEIGLLSVLGRGLDVLLLFNSVYLAMFCVHFCSAMMSAAGSSPAANAGVAFVALVPALITAAVAGPLVVLRFSFVSFVIELRPEVLGLVIEDQEESANLRLKVHKRLIQRLTEVWDAQALEATKGVGTGKLMGDADGKLRIRQVFDEIDGDSSGCLDRDEFQRALRQLGVYLSRKIFDRLMRVIDEDHSGTVDYHEFIALVYDDNDTLLEVLRSKLMLRYGAKASAEPSDEQPSVESARAVSDRLKAVFTSLAHREGWETGGENTGELTVDGFTRALDALEIEISAHLLTQLLTIFDADGSGGIDFIEFQSAFMAPAALKLVVDQPIQAQMSQRRLAAFRQKRPTVAMRSQGAKSKSALGQVQPPRHGPADLTIIDIERAPSHNCTAL
jgi:Ca2+-binding EF-hand superfamily protein